MLNPSGAAGTDLRDDFSKCSIVLLQMLRKKFYLRHILCVYKEENIHFWGNPQTVKYS